MVKTIFWQEASNDKAYYLLALDGERVIGYVGVWILFDEAQNNKM